MDKQRIELHLHTNMSAMDGINTASEYIKDAIDRGMSAIAITDHGVVQAFPEAYKAAKGKDIKLIYGMEAYMVNDIEQCISGETDCTLDDEVVVVDIETTGLNPKTDRITEIAAYKINNGEITDTFKSLVNPEMEISEEIVELTGITNEMVKDADKVEDVLRSFLGFCGNAIIVAHNAEFDLSFIKHNLSLIDIEYKPTIIDTLALTRGLIPDLKRFKLNDVCEAVGVELKNNHRADNDAEATALVFIKLCEKIKAKGISNIQDINDSLAPYYNGPHCHTSILVKNKYGLKNLYKIVSLSHTKYFHKVPRVPKSELERYRDGLLIGSGCECGELYSAITKGKTFDECCEIARFYDYIEIVPIENFKYFIEQGYADTEDDLKSINEFIIKIADHVSRPVVAVGDVHFLYSDDGECRKILMHNKGYSDYKNQPELILKCTEEMIESFSYLDPDKAYEIVVENSNYLAEEIDDTFEPFPKEMSYPKMDDSDERITMWSYIGARRKYGEHIPPFVEERLNWELEKIKENGYADLYLIAAELVKPSKRKGYVVGNRGCIASSLVAYFLEITEINPVLPHYYCEKCGHYEINDNVFCGCDLGDKACPKCGEMLAKDGFNIPAETFMGADGEKEPDIDFNFASEIRNEAEERLKELFGECSVIRAGTVSTLGDVSACISIQKYCQNNKIVYSCDRMNEYIRKLQKVKRTTGMHPGGSYIIPHGKEISDYTPIQYPANNIGMDVVTTHFDNWSLFDSLFKFDILTHDTPSMLRKLEQLTGVNPETIPLGDKDTMKLFSEGRTNGVPEFYTDCVKQMMKITRVKSFDDLIRLSGLSHGTGTWLETGEYDIKQDEVELSDLISTRDDVMIYLQRNGYNRKEAFKISERVRKGKGLTEEQEEELYQKGIPEWYIDSCNTVKYLFPRAHAASYVLLAYRVAYYKAHYPLEFYCAYFTIHANEFDADLLINNSYDLGKRINEIREKEECMAHDFDCMYMMETCQEMYDAGYKFVSDTIKNDSFESFFIEDGKLRPKLKYN